MKALNVLLIESKFRNCINIDWCAKNLTQLWIWPFYDHFSHFFASYINIFYKNKVQTIILRCLTSLNLNWIKSYSLIATLFDNCVFQFRKRKKWKFKFSKWPFPWRTLIFKLNLYPLVLFCDTCYSLLRFGRPQLHNSDYSPSYMLTVCCYA